MTPAQLSRTVVHAVRCAVEAGELSVPTAELARLAAEAGGVDGGARQGIVRVPPRPDHGDFTSHLALRLAGTCGRTPREAAEVLRRRLVREPGIARVEVAGPGFVNITLAGAAHAGLVREILTQGSAYGTGTGLDGERLRLRYVPGPRAALFAEVSARMATACGAQAVAIAYGAGKPVPAAETGGPAPVPGSGDTAPAVGPVHTAPVAGPVRTGPVAGVDVVVSVREPGPALGELEASLGRDGARWALLRAAAHDLPQCDPATVLAQRESNPLFRVQYAHARVRALLRNGRDLGVEPCPEDGASGEGEGNGAPCGGFAPAPTGATGPHGGAERRLDDAPDVPAGGSDLPAGDPHVPVGGSDVAAGGGSAGRPDAALLALLADYPRVVEAAARRRAPDRLARELTDIADAFFRFHDGQPPLPRGEQKPTAVHRTRLATAEAAGTVLAHGLSLLGISAPAHL